MTGIVSTPAEKFVNLPQLHQAILNKTTENYTYFPLKQLTMLLSTLQQVF